MNSRIVAQEQASTVNGGCYFLWAFGGLLLFPEGLWMVAGISWISSLLFLRLLERAVLSRRFQDACCDLWEASACSL